MDFWQTLAAANVAPPSTADDLARTDIVGGDITPLLIAAWQRQVEQHRKRGQTSEINVDDAPLARLLEMRRKGAQLTWGVSAGTRSENLAAERRIHRFMFWPRGVVRGRRIGLVSSRLGRRLEARTAWFDALRTTCARLDARNNVLVTAGATTTDPYIRRCGELFGLRILKLQMPSCSQSLAAWFEQLVFSDSPGDQTDCVFVSPALETSADDSARDSVQNNGKGKDNANNNNDDVELPLRDQCVVNLCDRVIALSVRRNGNLHRLIKARLGHHGCRPGTIYIATGRGLTDERVTTELLDAGGVGWLAVPQQFRNQLCDQEDILNNGYRAAEKHRVTKAASISRLPFAPPWPYLSHWTRAPQGAWPGETDDQFLDNLVLGRPGADHSVLATLARIVAQRRIASTSTVSRGNRGVVSFTEVPIEEFSQRRVFRKHLARWDFEPYGISISKEWLRSRGASPVIYGDESAWKSLSHDQSPFFQVSQSRVSRENRECTSIDWTAEREWRHVGDLDLDELPSDAAAVFVPDERAASHLAGLSRWPVVILQPTVST